MIDVSALTKEFLFALDEKFKDRVWFVGLQGSYGRGEATETSDIDIVVILDKLSVLDIKEYNLVLDKISHREFLCGFFSGKDEILSWEPSDLFWLYYDTIPIRGSLDELLPLIDSVAVDRTIKIGVCNIYHSCVHNMLYGKSGEMLTGLYKLASFVVRAICFKQTGNYVRRQRDLLQIVSAEEAQIINTYANLKNGAEVNFNEMSEVLLAWAKKLIGE